MSKFYDAIMGLIVGDALGVPFEFQKRDHFTASGMIGHGTYDQPAGTWSDDSSMTIATIESIVRTGKIDLADMMNNFYKWLFLAKFTPHGKVFDVGGTTQRAIEKYRYDKASPLDCGGSSIRDNGNGSLMRILPLAFCDCDSYDIYRVSALTHAHIISQIACDIYISIARNLLAGKTPSAAIVETAEHLPIHIDVFNRLKIIDAYPRREIKSTGYVVDTLEAALWCLLKTDNYKSCVLKAVNLGGDTDTIAAIAGGLAGIYYGVGGEKGIPQSWVSQIARKTAIEELCDAFETKHSIKYKG
jgi:ADP-ribosylglycohydrolase